MRVASTVVVSTWCWSARCSNQIFKRPERITSVTTCHTPSRHATPMTNLNELLVKSSVEFSGKRDWVLSYIEGDVCHLPNSPPKLYWSVIQQVRPVMKNSGRPTIQDFLKKWLVRNHLSIAFENHLHKLDKYESLYRVGVGFPTSTLRGWLESQVSSSTFLKDEKPERWGPVFYRAVVNDVSYYMLAGYIWYRTIVSIFDKYIHILSYFLSFSKMSFFAPNHVYT